MGIISSEKIFIDPKEEINFIIDRSLSSEKDRLIFVVPQNSILLSSPISVNILFRQLAKTKKVGIIVTEDDYGTMIAKKAGFTVVPKVSQITAEVWEAAILKKSKYLEVVELRKKELLSGIGLIDAPEPLETEVLEIDGDGVNQAFEIDSTDPVEQKEIITEESESLEEASKIIQEEISVEKDVDEVTEENIAYKNETDIKPEEEDALSLYKKPKMQSKVIEVDGLKLMAGGDIRNFRNSSQGDTIHGEIMEDSNINENIPDRKVRTVNSSSFAGKDFTKLVSSGGGLSFFDKLFGGNKRVAQTEEELGDLSIKKARRKKILTIAGIVGVVLFLFVGYLLAFQYSSVDVTVSFKKEDVSASANVLANPDVTEVSFDPVVIPVRILSEEKISMSRTGEASGTGKSGTKAKGFVTIYNITPNTVNLPKGTKLTNIVSNKEYVLLSDVVLEAGQPGDSSQKDNIQIEAVDYGSEYNIPLTAETVRLRVEGYQGFGEVYAGIPGAIEGGSSEEFTAVSQENVDNLKEQMLPELKSQGENKIRSLLPTGYTLLSDTIEFKESAVSSLPKVGEKAEDGSFTLSIEGSITAYAVSNEDLRSIGERLLSDETNNDEDNDLIVDEVSTPQIIKVEKATNGYILTISTEGSIGIRPSDDTIKQEIAGKSIAEAFDYLESIESIEDYRINFSPLIVPESFRRIPSDLSRISIRTR